MSTTDDKLKEILKYQDNREVSLVTSYKHGNGIDHIGVTDAGNLEIKYIITTSGLFKKPFSLRYSDENRIEKRIQELLGKSIKVSIEDIAKSRRDVRKEHQVTIIMTPEVFFEKLFDPRKHTSLTSSSSSVSTKDYSLFKNRQKQAQQKLPELSIYREDEAPDFKDADDDRIFRDMELRMLGTKSTSLMFHHQASESSKHFPWEQNSDKQWACELSTLGIDTGREHSNGVAERMEARFRDKYGMKDLDVRANSTNLFVYLKNPKELSSLCTNLMSQAGISGDDKLSMNLLTDIARMTPEVEVISMVYINLGVDGTTHDPYQDARLKILANGKSKETERGKGIGNGLCSLIETANSTDEISFDKTVTFVLKIPNAIVSANNIKPWQLLKKGILGIPKPGTSGGDLEINIYSNNIHQVADALADMFKNTPQFGFDAMNDSQGVQRWRELTGQER